MKICPTDGGKMSKAILYFLNSKDNAEDEALLSATKKMLEKNGFEVARTVRRSNEPSEGIDLHAILDAVVGGEIHALGIYSLAHIQEFMDSALSLLHFLARLADHKVRLLTVSEGIDSDQSAGEFSRAVIANFYNAKKLVKIARIHQGLKRAQDTGIHVGRPKKANDAAISELRSRGLSFKRIANELGISVGSVQYSLRKMIASDADL